MIRTIDLTKISTEARKDLLAIYNTALRDEDVRMTMEEAAWLYGYAYNTIRLYVIEKRIRTTGKGVRRRISHKAMRAYLSTRQKDGRPRARLVAAQMKMA